MRINRNHIFILSAILLNTTIFGADSSSVDTNDQSASDIPQDANANTEQNNVLDRSVSVNTADKKLIAQFSTNKSADVTCYAEPANAAVQKRKRPSRHNRYDDYDSSYYDEDNGYSDEYDNYGTRYSDDDDDEYRKRKPKRKKHKHNSYNERDSDEEVVYIPVRLNNGQTIPIYSGNSSQNNNNTNQNNNTGNQQNSGQNPGYSQQNNYGQPPYNQQQNYGYTPTQGMYGVNPYQNYGSQSINSPQISCATPYSSMQNPYARMGYSNYQQPYGGTSGMYGGQFSMMGNGSSGMMGGYGGNYGNLGFGQQSYFGASSGSYGDNTQIGPDEYENGNYVCKKKKPSMFSRFKNFFGIGKSNQQQNQNNYQNYGQPSYNQYGSNQSYSSQQPYSQQQSSPQTAAAPPAEPPKKKGALAKLKGLLGMG